MRLLLAGGLTAVVVISSCWLNLDLVEPQLGTADRLGARLSSLTAILAKLPTPRSCCRHTGAGPPPFGLRHCVSFGNACERPRWPWSGAQPTATAVARKRHHLTCSTAFPTKRRSNSCLATAPTSAQPVSISILGLSTPRAIIPARIASPSDAGSLLRSSGNNTSP